MKEFHILRKSRDLLNLDAKLFSVSGNVVFADLSAAKKFVHTYNRKTKKRLKPGDVFTVGIIDEILHYVCSLYKRDVKASVFQELLFHLYERIGLDSIEKMFDVFVEEFPPSTVYSGKVSKEEYLQSPKRRVQRRALLLEELLILWVDNMNPAFSFLNDVMTDESLRRNTCYLQAIKEMKNFFDGQEVFGPKGQNLVEMLRSPAVHEPNSLEGQLRYIIENWGYLLGNLLIKIKGGVDVLKEERVFFFLGPQRHEILTYDETVQMSGLTPDREWMRDLILIAKHTHVWLSQLSRKYGKNIERIDEIPDEELELLKDWGINGLWLIGLWERSAASKKIKNLCGNLDAIASAYSIYDYRIAEDLGGETAYETLKRKAESFGIKIGCDMVPNHMGICSKWMIEKPKWFIYRSDNPYPWYTFSSENLSCHENVEIYIEDHYYDRTDAAVVCKRVDKSTGEVLYIYHGNDGTGMPWNDTVQLNYLLPEVRETMIKTILDVARKFSIIRFDAAMTLTKMHYQRLWFPEPGKGGAIPTRAEFGMSKEEFDRHMPNEFWREVVDRVRAESPDTLLIAEAFWLLEGYFVKNLGMHRVYNSAFMNMLRDEENGKYRKIIKNTLQFDPEILKRFVNFMNNPDERTAYEQFGDGDKYFGVCTMMVTMPGLPMFGHGQIECFKEKYGMEFKKPYLNEEADEEFIKRHEREIFPLMRKRHLFSGIDEFFFYDFTREDGKIDEDVFAFSNRYKEEKVLVVYHNRNKNTEGWINWVVPKAQKKGSYGSEVPKRSLCEALEILPREGYYTIFRESRTCFEYVFEGRELKEKGLYLKLRPYQCFIFLEIRELEDDGFKILKTVATKTKGEGIKSVHAACEFMRSFSKLVDFELAKEILTRTYDEESESRLIAERTDLFLQAYRHFSEIEPQACSTEEAALRYRETLRTVLELRHVDSEKLLEMFPFLSGAIRKNQKYDPTLILYFLLLWQSLRSFLATSRESRIGKFLLCEAIKDKMNGIVSDASCVDSIVNSMLENFQLLCLPMRMQKK